MVGFAGNDLTRKMAWFASVLAVVMLAFLGGRFTHFDNIAHSHFGEIGSFSEIRTSHDHAEKHSDEETDDTHTLHCGANILALTESVQINTGCMVEAHNRTGSVNLTGLQFGFDPPPPRKFS